MSEDIGINVAGNLGAPFGEDAEELQGNLVAPGTPLLSGGYANIFRGIWRSSDGTLTDVAVKTLKPIRPTSMSRRDDPIALQQRREKRLRREVAVWARLRHPNIQPLLGFRTQPEPCLVSQWCENGNLVNYLDNNPDLSRPEKLQLLVQAARGLNFLHSQSPPICHADIKPENVLVNDLCEAALSDFGLSRVIQELDASTGFTTGDGPKGSQNYMAPELFEEENSKPTLETDVYAFGGLTLAVMSGSPPFAQINAPAKVLFRIVHKMHPKPEEHLGLERNDPLWDIMLRCWAHEPQGRPTISEVVVELKNQKKRVGPSPATETESTPSLLLAKEPRPSQFGLTPFIPHSDIGQLFLLRPGPTGHLFNSRPREFKLLDNTPRVEGPYSAIYKGLLQLDGVETLVCVKALRNRGEELFESPFRREMVIWAAADHPNILQFLNHRKVSGSPCFISPWARNGNLAAYLDCNDVSKREKLKMLQCANTGLAYLHGLEPPIAHGNLQPENILVLDDLTTALCGFRTSRRVIVNQVPRIALETAGTTPGPIGYAAQELILGKSLPTPASDIYATAGVILATLTRKEPLYQKTREAQIAFVTLGGKCDPADHPELPAADPLWELLRQCWASEPLERPSANEVIQNLEKAIEREPELPPLHTEEGIEVDPN